MTEQTFDERMRSGEPVIIGEIGQAHDGSLGTAHALVDAIADAGATAVKFQTHLAHAESTPDEPWRVRFSQQDASRYDYWQRMEFTEPQWQGLRDHVHERGLHFLSSPFSSEAVALLTRVGIDAWKISSGEIANLDLVTEVARTGLPVVLSTGMSPWSEVDRAVAAVRDAGAEVAVLQCTTEYPTSPEQVGLNVLADLAERYRCPVGLSDHSATIFAGLAAVALGATIVEVHVTLSRRMFGPDTIASLTDGELGRLVEGCRWIRRALDSEIDKDAEASRRAELRAMFTKSLYARHDLGVGHVIVEGDLVAKKPGTGIAPDRAHEVLGRPLQEAVAADEALRWDIIGERP